VLAKGIVEASMAQVWVTFEEIQDLFGCDAASARSQIILNQWERRRCTDGLIRAQLPAELAQEFMLGYASKHMVRFESADEFGAAMAALCQIFGAETDGAPTTSIRDFYKRAS
jgi:hypothetical protein